MAVYSMTGFANASAERSTAGDRTANADFSTPSTSATVHVELRSVNARFLDLAFRLPDELRGLEPALRELLTASVRRGKVELRLWTRDATDDSFPQPRPDRLNRLLQLESVVHGWLPRAAGLSVDEVLHWCKGGGSTERLDETGLDATRRCIVGLREARAREGARLAAILLERVARLRALAAEAEPIVPAVVERQQRRFLERWAEALRTAEVTTAALPAEALQERALTEAAAYAVRIDVAEELARLRSHLDEIERLLAQGGELGKRLEFLIQELLREANTLGSKAAALELTHIAVEMKVAIEQMREQVQNIE